MMIRASWDAVVAAGGPAVRVVVAEAEGSVPREPGAAMVLTEGRLSGTIGGGTLEFDAIARARRLLAGAKGPWARDLWHVPLGPALGQCCGGRVTLLAEVFGAAEAEALDRIGAMGSALLARPVVAGPALLEAADRRADGPWPLRVGRVVRDMLSGVRPKAPALVRIGRDQPAWFVEPMADEKTPLVIYGAGHVGRALVRVLDGLPFAVTWVDTARERFPEELTPSVARVATSNLAEFAALFPAGAYHIVMTFSHALDLAICHAVLARGDFAHLGLIGSATKRARFVRRLGELGVGVERLERLVCPIGRPGLAGKAPAVIAVSVAADVLERAAIASASVARPPTVTTQSRTA